MPAPDRKRPTARQLWHVVSLVLVALASTAAGFLVVVLPTGQGWPGTSGGPRGDGGLAHEELGDGGQAGERDGAAGEPGQALASAGSAPDAAAVLDGLNVRPAPGIKLGEPFYWRCWEEGKQAPMHEGDCDRMKAFERLVASRLGEVARCAERLDEPDLSGVLSLAVDVDFGPAQDEKGGPDAGGAEKAGNVRYWSSQSTTIKSADAIIACVRRELEQEELPLEGISHRFQRYTVFFPIEFPGQADAQPGTAVEMVLDKVRLREEPEKGRIIARLRRGEPVRVLEVREGWAKVRTTDGNEGWVYADAIKLSEE